MSAPAGTQAESRARRWAPVVWIFATRLLAVCALALVGTRALGRTGPFTPSLAGDGRDFVHSFFHWDPVIYLRIAQHGYTLTSRAAYFPLYPLLIRAGAAIGLGYTGSALAISWLGAAALAAAVSVLMRECYGLERWKRAVLVVLWAPASFTFFSGYPEALEAAFLALTLVACHRRRWWWAAAAAACCSASAPAGAVCVLAVVAALVQDAHAAGTLRRAATWVRVALAALVSEAGLLAYAAYLWAHYGSPLEFERAEAQWDRVFTYPGHQLVWPIVRTLRGELIGTPGYNANFVATNLIDIGTMLLAIGAIVAVALHLRRRGAWSSPLVPGALVALGIVGFNLVNATAGGVSAEAIARHLGIVAPLAVPAAWIRREEVWSALLAGLVVAGTVAQLFYFHGLWFT